MSIAQTEKRTPVHDIYMYVERLVADMKMVRSRPGLTPKERASEAQKKKDHAESVGVILGQIVSQLNDETGKLEDWLDDFKRLHKI